jgi:crossover junction endodeoxyribonuclease RuvC
MIYIGIDPGASGAIAVIHEGSPMPLRLCRLSGTEREVDDFMRLLPPSNVVKMFALIERVHSMPKQGVASSFKFGQSYGFLRGLLTAYCVPFEEVNPAKWQGALSCRTKGDKNVTKQKAGQLFPGIKVAHWNADALLIAEYCRRTKGGGE